MKPLSDQLLDAIDQIDAHDKASLQSLLRRAAVQLRAFEVAGTNSLEHIPVSIYHLLRRVGQGPVGLESLYGRDNEGAVAFLVSRGLAEISGTQLRITRAGRAIGEIEAE